MQTVIDKCTDIKTSQKGQLSSKIYTGSEYWFYNGDGTMFVGKTVQFDAEERTGKSGGKYKIAHNVKVVENAPPAAVTNGAPCWDDYVDIASKAHALACDLEPDSVMAIGDDGKAVVSIDRSRARMALVATFMIALSNNKIAKDESDSLDPTPF
jgi:hypothetical protein